MLKPVESSITKIAGGLQLADEMGRILFPLSLRDVLQSKHVTRRPELLQTRQPTEDVRHCVVSDQSSPAVPRRGPPDGQSSQIDLGYHRRRTGGNVLR